ncbi:MAG: type II secretion system protein [Phycisphaerales bacterium]
MKRASSRGGFTLIELLVVVAIIALLIGIILPSLGRAREAARAAKCLSNQRQIGLAFHVYCEEFRDYHPRESGYCEAPGTIPARCAPTWAYMLRPLVKSTWEFVDPRVDMSGGVGDRFESMEMYHDPSRPADGHNIHYVNNGISFRDAVTVNFYAKHPTSLAAYSEPSSTFYLACFTDDPNKVHWNNVYNGPKKDWEVSIFYDMHHIENVTGTMPGSVTHSQRIAPKRHTNGANGLYLDGHARLMPAAEITDYRKWNDKDYNPDVPWTPPPWPPP